MSALVTTRPVYTNTPPDRITITISEFVAIGWTKEQVLDRIDRWLAAHSTPESPIVGYWWEQDEALQARLHAAMRVLWENEFNGCADF